MKHSGYKYLILLAWLLLCHFGLKAQISLSCILTNGDGSVTISYTGLIPPGGKIKVDWGLTSGNYTSSYTTAADPGSSFNIPYPTIDARLNPFYFKLTALDVSGTPVNTSAEGLNPLSDPVIDSVSVVSNDPLNAGKVMIKWEASKENNVMGYYILRKDAGGLWPIIDNVLSNVTSYIDHNSTGNTNVYQYAILAYDQCGNKSSGVVNQQFPQNNIVLNNSGGIDPCKHKATLTWNQYLNMLGGVEGYKVYRTVPGGSKDLIATLSPTITTYSDVYNFVPGVSYLYQVTAYNKVKNITSSSGQLNITYNGLLVPDSAIILNASVQNNKDISSLFYMGPPNTMANIVIERSPGLNTPDFSVIDSIMNIRGGQGIPYLDLNTDVQHAIYSYRIRITDECNATIKMSDIVKSILLTLNSSTGNKHSFSWNAPLAYNGIKEYEIFRIVNGTPEFDPIKVLDPSSELSYTDEYTGSVCDQIGYYIVAVQKDFIKPSIAKNDILSNIIYTFKDPVYFPTAFHPGSKVITNRIFKPIVPCQNTIQSFEMYIYNQWGELVFQTLNPDNGWDGRTSGQPSPIDTFTYQVRYSTNAGKSYTKQGTITLVR